MKKEDSVFSKNIGREIGISVGDRAEDDDVDLLTVGVIQSVSGRWLEIASDDGGTHHFNTDNILYFTFEPEEFSHDGKKIIKAVHQNAQETGGKVQ
jgi:hypothetical protein